MFKKEIDNLYNWSCQSDNEIHVHFLSGAILPVTVLQNLGILMQAFKTKNDRHTILIDFIT